jgi:hypothetical protein
MQVLNYYRAAKYHLLDGLCSHSRNSEISSYQHVADQQSVLSNAASRLADRLLDFGREMDIRGNAIRIFGDASLLL